MNQDEFEEVFEHMIGASRDVLVEKAREYANDGDRMHNFKRAAGLSGRTPEQMCWGFNIKHLVSITDMVESGESYPEEKWDEKLGDALNYLILLKALITEANAPDRIALHDGTGTVIATHEAQGE